MTSELTLAFAIINDIACGRWNEDFKYHQREVLERNAKNPSEKPSTSTKADTGINKWFAVGGSPELN